MMISKWVDWPICSQPNHFLIKWQLISSFRDISTLKQVLGFVVYLFKPPVCLLYYGSPDRLIHPPNESCWGQTASGLQNAGAQSLHPLALSLCLALSSSQGCKLVGKLPGVTLRTMLPRRKEELFQAMCLSCRKIKRFPAAPCRLPSHFTGQNVILCSVPNQALAMGWEAV